MRISDPKWPAIREAAKILIRDSNIGIEGPVWLGQEVHLLNLMLSEHRPERLDFPQFSPTRGNIDFFDATTQQMIIHCGLDEPHIDVIWIPLPTKEAWMNIYAMAIDLVKAGYPGCLGCIEPEIEVPWNELSYRETLQESAHFSS